MKLSPFITHISWGHIEVEGLGSGKDFKLYPGGGEAWDWSASATHHVPGIQLVDIHELIERGSEVIILSRGILLKLEIAPETSKFLEESGIPFHTMETKLAIALYNHQVRQNIRVGGLFHSTC